MHRRALHHHIADFHEARLAAIEYELDLAGDDDAVVKRLRAVHVRRLVAGAEFDEAADAAVGLDKPERARGDGLFVRGDVDVVGERRRRGGGAVDAVDGEVRADALALARGRGVDPSRAGEVVGCDVTGHWAEIGVLFRRGRHDGVDSVFCLRLVDVGVE